MNLFEAIGWCTHLDGWKLLLFLLVSIFESEEIVLSLLVCGFFIRLPMEMAPLGTYIPPMQILVFFLVDVTGSWGRGRRVRNIVSIGMRAVRLNSAMIGHSMSGGKSEVAGVKVHPFLQIVIVSTLTINQINHILGTLDLWPSKPPRGCFPYVLNWRFSLSDNG